MNFKTAYVGVLAASCVLLASCGGGGGGDDAMIPGGNAGADGGGVPASAQSSVSALVAYVKELIAGNSEGAEPLTLGNITLPVDNTAEPASL